MDGRPVVVLANPAAGSGRATERAARLVATLRALRCPALLILPGSSEETSAMAARHARDASALVACGGDGTANLVMNACLPEQTPFGLLPAGTGDDNARSLGAVSAPEEMGARIAAWLTGSAGLRDVDIAWASCADGTERGFLGVMSTGIDSTVNERANGYRHLHGTARYVVALAAELGRMRPVPYEIRVDDTLVAEPALLASIGNGRSYGGGMLVCPAARVDDGLLEVTVLAHVPRRTFVRVFPRVFRGTHVSHPAVSTLRGATVRVAATEAVAYADGERFGPLPVTVSVRPKALRLVGGAAA